MQCMHIITKRCHLLFGLGFIHRNPSLLVFLEWYNMYNNLVVYNNEVIVDPNSFCLFFSYSKSVLCLK